MPGRGWLNQPTVVVWLGMALVAALLASGLPPGAFYAGDPGVKLIAAMNASAWPKRPLDIPIPTIGTDTLPFLDPFFIAHGDHAHAVTSELFPLLSAPIIAWLGLRGAYLLPYVGFLLTLAGCARVAVKLDPRRNSSLVVLLAGLTTPLLFYGLEFWEHAPAVGVAAAGMTLVLTDANGPSSSGVRARHRPESLAGGVLLGLAVLLRPEALWFAAGVTVALWRFPEFRRSPTLLPMGCGIGVALLPLAAYTWAHFGTLTTPHFAGNLGLWGSGWLAHRLDVVRSWLLSLGSSSLVGVSPVILFAAVPIDSSTDRRGRAFLAVVAAVDIAFVVLTAPNDGGAQWGPRYLLFAYVPLTILAADAVSSLVRRGALVAGVVVIVLGLGLWVERVSYIRLRNTKMTYDRLITALSEAAHPGDFVVSDLWWLDQVAARLTGQRLFLYAADAATGREIIERLDRNGARRVVVVRSQEDSPDVSGWNDGTCFKETTRNEIPERSLVAFQLERSCGGHGAR